MHRAWLERTAGWISQFAAPLILCAMLCSLVVRTGFREDEVQCEETVAYLADCCPGFDLEAVSCTYQDSCDPVLPDLSVEESRCIRSLSCAQIRERGLCEFRGKDAGADAASDTEPVCQ